MSVAARADAEPALPPSVRGAGRASAAARRRAPPLLLVLVLVGAWELYVDLCGVERELLPAPHEVAAAIWHGGACCGGTSR